LQAYLDNVSLQAPKIALLHNADVAAHADSDAIKAALVRQLYSPVRWVETVQSIYATGINLAAECGPGKVLAGLTKRIVPEFSCVALTTHAALTEFQAKL
jgi:[acyl-carrier-protein] S-malonyltransferase